jgi:hypothetical protein
MVAEANEVQRAAEHRAELETISSNLLSVDEGSEPFHLGGPVTLVYDLLLLLVQKLAGLRCYHCTIDLTKHALDRTVPTMIPSD